MEVHRQIPVVILCGGLGTRMREETEYKPKPTVEIGGRPVLWHSMKLYAHYGFRRFILCLGYKGSVIRDYFINYEAMSNDFAIQLGRRTQMIYQSDHTEQDFEVTLADTGLRTMTGGCIKRIERFIDTETFMVTYGDGLANLNIGALVDYHMRHGKSATLTTTRPPSRYGMLNLQPDGQIGRFREKMQTDWINVGFFVFNRRVFEYLDLECVLEQ
jgi:glucose-1-phosphate cytidylyltransferase